MGKQDQEYRTKVYTALKGELGDSFTKTEAEFNTSLDNDEGYATKVYGALKGELGESFTKGEEDFYSLVKKKADGEGSAPASEVSSEAPSESQSIEDRFPFLQGDDPVTPVAEASSTRVQPPAMDKSVVETSETGKKLGLIPPSEKEFAAPDLPPGLSKIQEWTGKKMENDPAYAKVVQQLQYDAPKFEQAGTELRTGLTTPDKSTPYERITEGSEFGRTAMGMLRGVNEGVANTLRTLDGAERAFWDAATGGNDDGGGWFGKAADYMDASLEENWGEVDKNQVVGNLVYNIGHLVPFFGEMMITPKIGKVGKLENLLTTKGFAGAYGDADVRREMGQDTKPLVEGLYGAGMGLKDALAFELLGYGTGGFGEVVARATRSGDAGVASSMLSNGLGFGAYSSLDEYIKTGEVADGTFSENALLGVALSSPGGMQMMDKAMNTYYGVHPANAARIRQLPMNVLEMREIEFSLLEQAKSATSVKEKANYISQAKGWHEAANFKAAEMVVVRDAEGTVKGIKSNESLSEGQKESMIQTVQESTLNAEVNKMQEEAATASEKADRSSSEGNVSPKGEKLTEGTMPVLQEVQERKIAKQQERVDLLDRLEKDGESDNIAEAVDNLTAKAEKMRETHEPQEVQEALNFIEKVKADAEVKIALEQTGVEHKISELKAESIGKQEAQKETLGKMDESTPSKEFVEKNLALDGMKEGKEPLPVKEAPKAPTGEKTAEALKSAAEKIRGLKGTIGPKPGELGMSVIPPKVIDAAFEVAAKTLELTGDAVKAVGKAIDALKKSAEYDKLSEKERIALEKEVRDAIEGAIGRGTDKEKERPLEATMEEVSIKESQETIPPVKPPKEQELAEGESPRKKTELELLSERVEARRKAQAGLGMSTWQKIGQVFQEHVVDVNEPFKRALMKEGVGAAETFINRMNLEAGASARAAAIYEAAQERIFGKGRKVMSQKKQAFLGEITDLIRTQELDNLYKSRFDERIAEEIKKAGRELTEAELQTLEDIIKEQNPMLKHEGKVGGKESTALLEKFRAKDPEFMKYVKDTYGLKDYDPAAIEKSISEYHKVLGEQLTELYEAGVIGKAAYEKLKKEQPFYSPRKYISHMDGLDPNGSMSGIKKLEGGSEGEKVIDMNQLMGDVIARTSSIVARNKKLQSGSAYAYDQQSDLVQNAPFSTKFNKKLKEKKEGDPFMEPEFAKTPRNKIHVDFYENGQKKRLWIDKEMYKYFDYAKPDEATEMTQYAISMTLGTPILKFFATGANPEFAVKNLMLDAMHVWMTTPEYSPIMPVAMKQILSDYTSVAHDAWTKTGQYKDFIKEGGGMNFLTTQGTDTPFKFKRYTSTSSYVGQLRDGAAKIGEFSESLTRLAVRKRYIDNRMAEAKKEGRTITSAEMKGIQEAGTALARNYLDFAQGGKTVKFIDKFIPYFNAGVQVTRGGLRAAAKNPALFTAKIAQITALATTLTAWNMGDSGDDELAEKRRHAYLNDVSSEVKARNFVIMTNMAYTDKSGNNRMLYFKIPKDVMQSSITSLAEDVYIKSVHDGAYKLMNDKTMTALKNELRNVTDLGNMPPLMRAMTGYKNNYDSFYETEIWSGREMPDDLSSEYYKGTTPPRYIKFGELTGMSPVRSQYFAKQFFTEGNLYTSILGEFFDGLAIGFDDNAKDVMAKEGYEKLKGMPGLRRVLKSTYPKPPEELEEEQRKLNKIKTDNDNRFKDVFMDKPVAEVDDEAVSKLLEETYERDGPYEAERMMDKIEDQLKGEGVGSPVKKLKWFAPEIRAVGFYRLLKESPDNADELWAQAEAAGIVSKRFEMEVGRLMDMESEGTPSKE